MNKLKKNAGITMISLVVTIIILVILSSIITYSGLSSIRNNKFEKLRFEMEIVQANVNLWYQQYIDVPNEEIDIGSPIPDSMLSELQGPTGTLNKVKEIADSMNIDMSNDISSYRYFSKTDFESLQISGIENNYIIDIKKQIAILVEAYEYNGTNYYIIDQVKDVIRGGSLVN